MASVRVDVEALAGLDRMIRTLNLPDGSRARVRRSLERLERFPSSGVELRGQWKGLRCLIGPWRWMLIVYRYSEEDDVIDVLLFEDSRMSTALRPR